MPMSMSLVSVCHSLTGKGGVQERKGVAKSRLQTLTYEAVRSQFIRFEGRRYKYYFYVRVACVGMERWSSIMSAHHSCRRSQFRSQPLCPAAHSDLTPCSDLLWYKLTHSAFTHTDKHLYIKMKYMKMERGPGRRRRGGLWRAGSVVNSSYTHNHILGIAFFFFKANPF